MRPVTAEIAIDARREEVFALLLDVSARPGFTNHFAHDFQLLRTDPVGVGAGARFRWKAAGGWLDSVIAEAEPPHRILERGRGGRLNRVPNITEWRLADAPGPSGCEVSVTFKTEPQTLAEKLRDARNSERRVRRDLKRALERLRDLVEEDRTPERALVAGGDRLGR